LTYAGKPKTADETHAAGWALCALLTSSLLFPNPTLAAQQVYPVTGVWVAIDAHYPAAAGEVCLAVKTFGMEAARKAVAELTIFSDNKRYDVKGPIETRTTVKSIKPSDGGFWITEVSSKPRRWFAIGSKIRYFLAVLDFKTIEIRDSNGTTRYTKCGPQRPAV
jgi:hypothetical protein